MVAPHPYTGGVKVEHDVWIGENVTVKCGITLHTGCVVGANSLVTKDVPPYAVVGGCPAKIIKYRFDTYSINKLLESQWFLYDVNYLDVPADIYVYEFINVFEKYKSELPKLSCRKLDEILKKIENDIHH